MVMGFSLKSIPRVGHASSLVNNQVVHRCIIPCIVLYCIKGALLPFLVEYFTKEMLISPTSFCLRDANGSAHECGACPLPDRYLFVRPFFDEKEVTTQCSGLKGTLINY
jgi:hypothetical protein